jgi:hypothetical protein
MLSSSSKANLLAPVYISPITAMPRCLPKILTRPRLSTTRWCRRRTNDANRHPCFALKELFATNFRHAIILMLTARYSRFRAPSEITEFAPTYPQNSSRQLTGGRGILSTVQASRLGHGVSTNLLLFTLSANDAFIIIFPPTLPHYHCSENIN